MHEDIEINAEVVSKVIGYLEKEYGRLSYVLLGDEQAELKPTSSRAGGLPYWNFQEEYPRDEQGQALCFICQVNLAQVAAVPLDESLQELKDAGSSGVLPQSGLLQFFASSKDRYGCTFEPDNPMCRVVYWADVEADSNLSMEDLRERLEGRGLVLEEISNRNLEQRKGVYWPISGEIGLAVKAVRAIPYGTGDYDQLMEVMDEAVQAVLGDEEEIEVDIDDILDELEEVANEQGGFGYMRSLSEQERKCSIGFLLGYPQFVQENPVVYGGDSERFDTLLLCLDGSGKVGANFSMNWADSGIADFFINGAKLEQQDFSDIFYTWDCY